MSITPDQIAGVLTAGALLTLALAIEGEGDRS